MNAAVKIDETIFRTDVQRDRAILNAGYAHAKRGGRMDECPYDDPADAELWRDGFVERLDDEAEGDPGEEYL